MNVPVKPTVVRERKAVYLSKDLPLGFGNQRPIPARGMGGTQTKGYVTSKGFEGGILHVHFPLYAGDERTHFNVESARSHLECDPWL